MTEPEDPRDRALLTAFREIYRPTPLTPARRAALLHDAQARTQSPARRWIAPAIGMGLAAGALGTMLLVLRGDPAPPSAVVDMGEERGWENGLVFFDAIVDAQDIAEADLPDEYHALAELFFTAPSTAASDEDSEG